MKLKEMDQFITDPEPSKESLPMLVDPVWLHQVLRKLHEQNNLIPHLERTITALQGEAGGLRHRLMVAQSDSPYTQLINLKV